MGIKLEKINLHCRSWNINAFVFLPDASGDVKRSLGIITHGYTSHKASILNWPTRLAEEGMASIIFDLPGHYLGSFNEVHDFEEFKVHSHEIFPVAFEKLREVFLKNFPLYEHYLDEDELKISFIGHSLGALLSLKALELEAFKNYNKMAISVGLGLAPKGVVHIFDTPLYKSTLHIREQLVSPAICPNNIFPWIKEEKKQLNVSGQRIHLLSGEDDVVVGKSGAEDLKTYLDKNNTVTCEKPKRLPHHHPDLAAGHIKKILKSEGLI